VTRLALGFWGLYFVVALALRVALHLRREGRTGLLLMRGRPGSVQWFAEFGVVVAFGLGVAAPLLAQDGTVEPLDALDRDVTHASGVALFALGLTGVAIAQEAMGGSWRIGVDPQERTELATRGPFRLVRNPIFTSVLSAQVGIALLVPSVVALVGAALMLLSVEVQVRAVEEPHLLGMHGHGYEAYARRVGRFVPGLGRFRCS
jgi:protein-S-isoprenylcysteine O-methyltransferase Ste14